MCIGLASVVVIMVIIFLCCSSESVTILGKKFHKGVVVCLLAPCDNDFPQFGEVTHVLVPEESKLLLVRKFHTHAYINHFNAYHITKLARYAVIDVTELALHDLFHPYNISSTYYVVVRSCSHVELHA